MLTRHSPPRALGHAEAGWLVGESNGRAGPSRAPGTARNVRSVHVARIRSGSFADSLPLEFSQNKKPASQPSCLIRKAAAVNRVSLRPRGQAGFLLDRFVGQTPASSLDSSTMAAQKQPPKSPESQLGDGAF